MFGERLRKRVGGSASRRIGNGKRRIEVAA
jgi:hypothetical protein